MLLFIYICLALPASLLACSCFPTHPQNSFCDSAFVIRAKIISVREVQNGHPGDIYYKIGLRQDYKNLTELEVENTRFLYASTESSLCGINLRAGKTYLITGDVYDGKLNINSCHWIQMWRYVPRFHKLALMENFYKDSCACMVALTGQVYDTKPGFTCFWNETDFSDRCLSKASFCRANSQVERKGTTTTAPPPFRHRRSQEEENQGEIINIEIAMNAEEVEDRSTAVEAIAEHGGKPSAEPSAEPEGGEEQMSQCHWHHSLTIHDCAREDPDLD